MGDDTENDGGGVESAQLRHVGPRHRRHRHGGEHVDRVPEASLEQDAIGEGHGRHRDACDETTLDPGRERLDLDRQPHAVPGLAELEVLDGRGDADDRLRALAEWRQRNVLDLLLGQDLVPPADAADQCERQPHDADDHVRDESGADQGEAERDHHGPHGGRGQCVGVRPGFVHRPMR